ncbi:MAG: Omp28-related outer membrane protein [Ignavibacteriaceae bacterium]
MKSFFQKVIIICLFFLTTAYTSEKKVLVEIFTNSHCPLCPPAHNAIESYLNGPNASKISFIYYHMVFPYPDDQLNKANPSDPAGRNSYYGPFSSTPVGFFDGTKQANNYSGWGSVLDNLITQQSPLEISLGGTTQGDQQFSLTANIRQASDITETDLVVHFVVAENVNYSGRNAISYHKHVMRKMITSPTGEPFSISLNETKDVTKMINVDNSWIKENLSAVVFVQSSSTKKVYQSETIDYNQLTITDVKDNSTLPKTFGLEQNYPNPFNPSTKIRYSIPTIPASSPLVKGRTEVGFVTIKAYNILGNEIAVLVNENKSPGNYEVNFDASNLSSGVYYYTLKTGSFTQTKKMILLK